MIDPDAKIRISWPGFCKDEEQDEWGKGTEDKSKKGNGDAEDCGCVYPCRNWCAGVKACCLNCAEALGNCPRCTCFRVRCCCGKLGHCLGSCLAGCSRLCGRVFSAIVTLVGCFGMVLMVYYLWPLIFSDEEKMK